MKDIICILSILLLFVTITAKAVTKNVRANNTWTFVKVSQEDLFGDKSFQTQKILNTIYSQVKITIKKNKLTINNLLLENDKVCSTDYIKIKKRPLDYFYSQKTTDLYKTLFNNEAIPLSSNIYILTASKPEKECSEPFSNIIENDNYLVVVDKYYLIFFSNKSQQDNQELLENVYEFRDDFPTYCQQVDKGKIFDGISKYICNYPNKTILDTYIRIKTITNDGQYMNKELPTDNISFAIQDGQITYQWMAQNILKVIIVQGCETTSYLFNEQKNNTNLIIDMKSGY